MQRFLYRLLRFALAIGCLLFFLTPAAQADEPNILVLGDSISAAYGMSLEQGWVALLEKELARQGKPVTLVNASISGETTAGGLRRLPALLADHTPTLVLIELGANDGLRGYPLQGLRDNLRRMVEAAQRAGARVLLLPMEIPPNYGARYAQGFRDAFASVAEETGAELAPFILEAFATDPAMMQADGIHPTSAAQPLMLQAVMPSILKLLETP
ncbi:MAG: arylesterase [Halioglobus sp.]